MLHKDIYISQSLKVSDTLGFNSWSLDISQDHELLNKSRIQMYQYAVIDSDSFLHLCRTDDKREG